MSAIIPTFSNTNESGGFIINTGTITGVNDSSGNYQTVSVLLPKGAWNIVAQYTDLMFDSSFNSSGNTDTTQCYCILYTMGGSVPNSLFDYNNGFACNYTASNFVKGIQISGVFLINEDNTNVYTRLGSPSNLTGEANVTIQAVRIA